MDSRYELLRPILLPRIILTDYIMPNLNRREEDRNPPTNAEQFIHYRRKANEAQEIREFLNLYFNRHSMRDPLMEKKSFRDCVRTFLDREFDNPIPEMIRKTIKIVTLQTWTAKRRESKCRQKNNN